MREILFRGKRTDNGKWVYGDYVSNGCGIAHTDYLNEYGDIGEVFYPASPETIGQYTDLIDKNHKKIFEGDIVHCLSNTDCGNCIVIFEEGEFRLVPDRYYKTYTTGGGYHAIRCFIKEVVGNIHDNPELLKGSAE